MVVSSAKLQTFESSMKRKKSLMNIFKSNGLNTEPCGTQKNFRKHLKKLGLPSKKEGQAKICLGKEGNIEFDPKYNSETFTNFYANLSMNLVRQLPLPTNMFGTNSVKEYYRHLNLENKNINFTKTTEGMVLALLQKIDPSKAVGLNNLGGRFLKDGAS